MKKSRETSLKNQIGRLKKRVEEREALRFRSFLKGSITEMMVVKTERVPKKRVGIPKMKEFSMKTKTK